MAKRYPRSVYQRNTPDYFIQGLATGGVANLPPMLQYYQASLFNSATDGSYLFVYGMNLDFNGGNLATVTMVQGAYGTLAMQGQSVQSDLGAQPGQIYTDQGGAPLTPTGLTMGHIIGSVFATPLLSAFPLWIVPPSWSLFFTADTTVNGVVANFWWVVLRS